MSHGARDVEEKPESRLDVELALVTVAVNVFPLDILQNKIGNTCRRYARIRELGDMWVRQPAQNAALAFKTVLAAATHQRQVEKLHRDAPLKPSISTFGQPNASHSTLSEQRDQRVGANRLSGQPGSGRWRSKTAFQKTSLR